MEGLTEREQRAALAACLMAAFADGGRNEAEREAVRNLTARWKEGGLDLEALRQQVLGGAYDAQKIAAELPKTDKRRLVYEMAVCVCDADGASSPREKEFLAALRGAFGLDDAQGVSLLSQADSLAVVPLASAPGAIPASVSELDESIRKTAILCGGLELLPDGLATLAILPIQMRLVYRIGKQHGFELDRGHIKDFLGVIGVGLTSQLVEGYARKLVRGLFGTAAGGLVGGLAGSATGPALSFATTYALGHAAQRYYASGRKLSGTDLRALFSSFFSDARGQATSHRGEMERAAREVDVRNLTTLVRES